ncbi:MAG TPA: 4Fe-4S binding protein [Clostridiaceae bacterium]|nr:4Fe-4S binding protein [Clostridiaceae bacterium]
MSQLVTADPTASLNTVKLKPSDIKRVKAKGCLIDKRTGRDFNVRVITRNGKITHKEMACIAAAAEKFGSGEVTMTVRLTLEIQGVSYENLDALETYLNEHGLEIGGTGAKVRPVVSCKGTTCQYGLIDTFDLSHRLHEQFYIGAGDMKLPHKFKIAVGGCPNSCAKPSLNDIGIVGQLVPKARPDKCRHCKVCQVISACPVHVCHVPPDDFYIDMDQCIHCGLCIPACPFDAVDAEKRGYMVYIGGRWGKAISIGRPLEVFIEREEAIFEIIDNALHFYQENGQPKERFAVMIDRIGFDNVQKALLKDVVIA